MAEGAILRPTQHSPQSLHTLADSLELERFGDDVDISGVALNTSAVLPGDIFVALQGAHRHGIEFWPQAKAAGASAVMTDPAGRDTLAGEDVSLLVATEPRRLLGALASKVYGTSRDGANEDNDAPRPSAQTRQRFQRVNDRIGSEGCRVINHDDASGKMMDHATMWLIRGFTCPGYRCLEGFTGLNRTSDARYNISAPGKTHHSHA